MGKEYINSQNIVKIDETIANKNDQPTKNSKLDNKISKITTTKKSDSDNFKEPNINPVNISEEIKITDSEESDEGLDNSRRKRRRSSASND